MKTLRRIPANTAILIRSKIEQDAADPASLGTNVAKLQGREGYRLRVADRRVLFEEDEDRPDVPDIGSRGSIDS
ncbi:MAG: type II toxin-antitoxin system RelE/ParE family toxin [Microvirga sp.]